MQLRDKPTYRVADIEIDLERNCLRREDREWALRQKSFQVLLYLLEHRTRLVTKDELIERIWGGAAVTDDVLVQIIVELRRTFGDDSRHPRFIRTVPKAGYQFIARVEIAQPGKLSGVGDGGVEIEEVTSVQVEIEHDADVALPAREVPADGLLTGNRELLRRPGVLIAVALIAVFAGVWFATRRGVEPVTEVSLPRVPGRKPVAVMYFDNLAGDRELDWLREGLADMLIAGLSRSQRLTLLSRQQLTALLGHTGRQQGGPIRLEEGLDIARRAQAEMIILGGFARIGEKVRIDITLHDARTGQLQAAESLIADSPEQILTQIDLLALKLSAHLGASLAEAGAEGELASVMTSSLDAYRYYSLALEQAQMFQFHEAVALLDKAIALDPQFAMAQARIGYIYAVRLGQGERARPYLERAQALGDRLSEKDKLFISAWLAQAERDMNRTIEVYRELTARYPMETEAYQRLAWALLSENRNEDALTTVRQGLLTDPEWKDLYNALGMACMRLGRNEDAVAAYQRYIELAPQDPNSWDSLGEFYRWVGRYEEAEAAYHRALALNPESGVAIIHLGHLHFQQGRYRAAEEQYRRHIQIARDVLGRARSYTCLGWLRLKRGDPVQAAAAVREEVRYNPMLVWNSLVLAWNKGDRAAAAKFGEMIFTPAMEGVFRERGLLRIWEYQLGQAALQEGRAEEAVNHFRAALKYRAVEWNIDSLEDCLAYGYLKLGRYDEAIAEYQRVLKINPRYPLAHYHLGNAWEGRGDRHRAQAAYREFLQQWKGADADIPEVVDAIARLK